MNKLLAHSLAFRSIITSLLYFLSSSSWAGNGGGTITYGPSAATPVPTLSGVMLIMLALLLAAIAFRILRQKDNHAGRMMVLSLLAVGTLASGLSGVKLIDNAYADPILEELTNPNGGTLVIDNNDIYEIRNATSGTATILNIQFNGCENLPAPDVPKCTVGLELADTESCFLTFGDICSG